MKTMLWLLLIVCVSKAIDGWMRVLEQNLDELEAIIQCGGDSDGGQANQIYLSTMQKGGGICEKWR